MSGETEKLKSLLLELELLQYHENFLKKQVLFSDLDGVLEDDLLDVIPERIHRRRLMKHLNSHKKGLLKTNSKVERENEEVMVQMFVKCGPEVENIYDVPLDSTNEELIGKLVQAFLGPCQVKLQGEERSLVANMKSFTLRKWFDKNERSVEETVRAVLNVKWPNVEKTGKDVEKLEKELEKVKLESEEMLEKERNALKMVEQEKERWRMECEKLLAKLKKIPGPVSNSSGRGMKEMIERAKDLYHGRKGLNIDRDKAFEIVRRLEKEEKEVHGRVYYLLGCIYKFGIRSAKIDTAKSDEYFNKAGDFYSRIMDEDEQEPEDWRIMGLMYLYGRGFEKNESKVATLLQKAVDGGNEIAMINLGRHLKNIGSESVGEQAKRSYFEKAIKMYSTAVNEFDLPEAMSNLAFMYAMGHGVGVDYARAFGLFLRASKRGERTAMYNTGNWFRMGVGVEKNVAEAKRWFERAAALGNKNSQRALETF